MLLPDVLVEQRGPENDLQQMTRRFVETGGHAQILVEPVPEELVSQYGVVDVHGVDLQPGQHALMSRVVEKPPRDRRRRSGCGRALRAPARIFDLENSGAGGEIQLTDAIAELMQGEGVEAAYFPVHDCGSKLGYLEATVAYGVEHPTLVRLPGDAGALSGEDWPMFIAVYGDTLCAMVSAAALASTGHQVTLHVSPGGGEHLEYR